MHVYTSDILLPTDEEYFYRSPDRLRLPLIFYLAHTATLYVNKMLLAGLIKVNRAQLYQSMYNVDSVITDL